MPEREYIERDALIARLRVSPLFLGREDIREGAIELVEIQPTAEVNAEALRPRGKWLENEDYVGDVYYTCSECRNDWYTTEGTPAENGMDFCPKCGAAMKGGKDINALTKTDEREEE